MYTKADTTEKQELVRLGFDNNLYYENGVYRTPTMIEELSHNVLIMRGKRLLIYEKIPRLADRTEFQKLF